MLEYIPPDAQTLKIPHLGEVLIFRRGEAWFVVAAGARPSRVGVGETRLDAVADLLMAE